MWICKRSTNVEPVPGSCLAAFVFRSKEASHNADPNLDSLKLNCSINAKRMQGNLFSSSLN